MVRRSLRSLIYHFSCLGSPLKGGIYSVYVLLLSVHRMIHMGCGKTYTYDV